MALPGTPKGYNQYSLPTMGGGQEDLYNMVKGQFSSGFGDVFQNMLGMAQGKPEAFAPQEKQAMNFFNQQLAPGIAQRYAGSGIGSSSGMQNALAGAAGNLTTSLQAQRQQMMQQSIHDVLGLGNTLLGMPTQQFGLTMNPWYQFMQNLGHGVGEGLGKLPAAFAAA